MTKLMLGVVMAVSVLATELKTFVCLLLLLFSIRTELPASQSVAHEPMTEEKVSKMTQLFSRRGRGDEQ